MALVIRRYRFDNLPRIKQAVHASATVAGSASPSVDIQINDNLDGVTDALDGFMRRHGFSFEAAATVATTLRITSPDGVDWLVSIDNAGALTTAVAP